MLSSLKVDKNADRLLEISMKEVELGRLSGPFAVDDVDLSSICISSRFGVEQGFIRSHVLCLSIVSCVCAAGV